MGPLVSKAQLDKVLGYVETGRKKALRLVCGGAASVQGFEDGFFVEPTVFAGVTDDMTHRREEIFGPVMSVLDFPTRTR
jgi:betaine-aldehyde dehydrogenase